MNRGLSYRRHQRERLKAKAKDKFNNIWQEPGLAGDPRMIGLHADNGQICSCYMCGNPRKHNGEKALGELRAEMDQLLKGGRRA